MAKTVLVIGANRGLGLEFAKQYAGDGYDVIATCRRPAEAAELRRVGVRLEALDTSTSSSIDSLAEKLKDDSIDVMICNAGVYGPRTDGLTDLPTEDFDLVMRTNVLGPLRLTLAFAHNVARAHGAMVFMSSRMGSISTMSSASGIAYRASKAALNMVIHTAALEWGPQGVTCISLHPGWVKTDMGGDEADIEPAVSIAGMRKVIAGAHADGNGRFFDYTGKELTW